ARWRREGGGQPAPDAGEDTIDARPVTGRPIRVLLADDHALVRQGMAEMLSPAEGKEGVGEAADGREAVDLARKHGPDAVVLDVEMPVMSGQVALRKLLDLRPPPKDRKS